MSKLNWADLRDAATGVDPLPVGEYDAEIIAAEATIANNSGRDMIKVRFEVTAGPAKGEMIADNMVIVPDNSNALGVFFRHLRALGFADTYWKALPSTGQVAKDMTGRKCRIQVVKSAYRGGDETEVSRIMPPPAGTMQPLISHPQTVPAPAPPSMPPF
jgi:hypothetical protein